MKALLVSVTRDLNIVDAAWTRRQQIVSSHILQPLQLRNMIAKTLLFFLPLVAARPARLRLADKLGASGPRFGMTVDVEPLHPDRYVST